MTVAELPLTEAERQADLLSYEVLDSEPDPRFEAFIRVATNIFDTPIAAVSLVDRDRQWFKAITGLAASETPRDVAFCAHAILTPDKVFVVNDAAADPRFSDNPLVTDGPKIRFYAGAPIISQDGNALGTLCVIDTAPRAFDEHCKKQLADLAIGVGSALELHRHSRRLSKTLEQRQQTERMLDSAFGAANAAVAVIDGEWRISMANAGLYQMLDYPAGTLAGRPIVSIIAPGFHETLKAARVRQATDGKDQELPVRLLDFAGAERPAWLQSVAVEQPDGAQCYVVTINSHQEGMVRPGTRLIPAPGPEARQPPHLQVAGNIQLVGLAQIREALGNRWPQISERALQTAEHVIKRRIGSSDTWARTADETFVICFSSATEAEAAFRSAAIAKEIRIRLIGQEENAAIGQVTSVAASIDVTPEQHGDGDIAQLVQRRLDGKRSQIEEISRKTLAAALTGEPAWKTIPVHVSRGNKLLGYLTSLPSELEARIFSAIAALPGKEAAGLSVSSVMLEMLVKQPQPPAEGLIIISVDYEVFSSTLIEETYFETCSRLTPEVKQSLVMTLSKVPSSLPYHEVAKCMKRLRPFCCRVALELDKPEVPLIQTGEPLILTIAMSRLTQGRPLQAPKLAKFLFSLGAHKTLLLVTDVPNEESAACLRASGVKLISMPNGIHGLN